MMDTNKQWFQPELQSGANGFCPSTVGHTENQLRAPRCTSCQCHSVPMLDVPIHQPETQIGEVVTSGRIVGDSYNLPEAIMTGHNRYSIPPCIATRVYASCLSLIALAAWFPSHTHTHAHHTHTSLHHEQGHPPNVQNQNTDTSS